MRVHGYWIFRPGAVAALIVAALAFLAASGRVSSQPEVSSAETIACHVLDAHTSQQPPVTLVVFHHRAPSESTRLGALLRAHSGEPVQFQTADGKWHDATVVRLKSCFGRGVLLFPAGAAQLAERDVFFLRFSPALGAAP